MRKQTRQFKKTPELTVGQQHEPLPGPEGLNTNLLEVVVAEGCKGGLREARERETRSP